MRVWRWFSLMLVLKFAGLVVAVPLLSRTLWPETPVQEALPQEVDVVQSTDARDSIVFAGIVAFSASVRLITSEMPLSRTAWRNVLALAVAGAVPTVIATSFALASPEQRRFSWVWAQLIMLVSLLGVSFTIAMEVVEPAENVNERKENTPLRALNWRFCRSYLWMRAPFAIFIVGASLTALIDTEGWDVLALSFAAVVLVLLGLEPRTRVISPIFNRMPAGFPDNALVVRSITDSKPLPIVYYVSQRGASLTLASEYSVYRNEHLGKSSARILLAGLVGRSLVDDSGESLTQSANTGVREQTNGSQAPLETLWPWLRGADLESLKPASRTIAIFALLNVDDFEDPSKLGALWIKATARVSEGPLQSLLALCNMIGGNTAKCITHYHMIQLWSQWLEVHAHYATSGLGYANLSGDDGNEENVENEALLQSRQDASQNPQEADISVVINTTSFAGGSPELWCVFLSLPQEKKTRLCHRLYESKAEQGAVAGDWLTRVLQGNQIDEIISSQAEWGLLLGLPLAHIAHIVKDERMLNFITSASGDDTMCCRAGLIVPGPGFGLLELIRDRSLEEQEDETVEEAASLAFLARHAFDVVSWGVAGTESSEDQFRVIQALPVEEWPQYLEAGPLQEAILDALLESSSQDFLHTNIVRKSMERFRGLNEYNNSQLHSFPVQMPVPCSVLGHQICPRANEDSLIEKESRAHLRVAELRLIAPERMAVMQLGISTFFALSALIRSL